MKKKIAIHSIAMIGGAFLGRMGRKIGGDKNFAAVIGEISGIFLGYILTKEVLEQHLSKKQE